MDDEDLIFSDEVCALLGINQRSRKSALTKARKLRAGGESGPYLFPEPVDEVTRTRPAEGSHPRRVTQPRWSRRAVLEYRDSKRGPGGRAPSETTEEVTS